jgi:very-short-patch-repair endonuclease
MSIFVSSGGLHTRVKLRGVNRTLRDLLDRRAGIVHRAEVLAQVEHHVLDQAVRSGRLVRVFPRVYVEPHLATDHFPLVDAALAYADGRAALSHTTALEVWRLPVPATGPVHLLTDGKRHLRGAPGLRVHRRAGFELRPPAVVIRQGRPVTRLEQAVVDSWPLLTGDAQRAPAICAVARRMTTPARLAEALSAATRLTGRQVLARLLRLLAAGCRSPLEIWGYDRVFRGPGFAGLRRQVPVRLGSRTVYLDMFDDDTRVNFELDGAKYHGDPADRERDLRRDGALAAMGITVVRYTHDRLIHEPDDVAREARAILRSRRLPCRAA